MQYRGVFWGSRKGRKVESGSATECVVMWRSGECNGECLRVEV